MAETPTLITIPFSHFCEKARWGADYAGFAYRERGYAPGLHVRPMRRARGRTVPVLVTSEATFKDSTDILKHLDSSLDGGRKLYPTGAVELREVDALVARFDHELGPAARLLAYHHLLPVPGKLASIVAAKRSSGERFQLRVIISLVRPLIRKRMGIHDESAARATATIERVFADMSARLEQREGGKGSAAARTFLAGDRFGAADLTFAALAAPVILPPGHPQYTSDAALLPETLRECCERLRATRAGQLVIDLYRDHRGVPAKP